MLKIDQNIQQVCDLLVYRYLVENGHYKTAELLKKERKKDYTLEVKKGEKISKIFSYLITKYGQSQLELDSVSNGLVYDYLKNHQNQKIQKLAEKLKALVPPIQTKSENPSIGDILNHANFSRKILVPVRKKSSNQLPNQAKRQKLSIKKASDVAPNSKEPTKNISYSFGSGEKIVPIKDVFKNRIEKKIKLGPFSHVISGEDSEECRIIKAWCDLIEEAQIIDKKQVIQDFDNLLNEQWPCTIVGVYLSKYLQVPRCALKVFELLTRSAFYTSGKFQEEEDEIIIEHMESQNGKEPDLNYLKAKLNRPRIIISSRIADLKAPNYL